MAETLRYAQGDTILFLMTQSVFISYSRRESPFVDALLDELEDRGVEVWLDYHCLVPGKPWLDQIVSGIQASDVMLLVVSKASMASLNRS